MKQLPLFLALLLLPATTIISAPVIPPAQTISDSLSLQQCFTSAYKNNATLQSAAYALEIVAGEDIVTFSRFLPQLKVLFFGAYDQSPDSTLTMQPPKSDQMAKLGLSQRLLEFGPTTSNEYSRLRQRLDRFYARENTVVSTCSDIRRTYFALQIIRLQSVQHDSLYALYAKRLSNAQELLTQGMGHKTTVLTERLNCLAEREAILSLRKNSQSQSVKLKVLLGVERIADSITLTTPITPLQLSIDSCVTLAFAQNTQLADARVEVDFAKRQLVDAGWNFGPSTLRLAAGISTGNTSTSLDLIHNEFGSSRSYSLSANATQTIAEPAGYTPPLSSFGTTLEKNSDTQLRYTAQLHIELPLFDGFKALGQFKSAGARYNQARADLLQKSRELEQNVRLRWFEYTFARQQQSIGDERLSIDRERYALLLTQYEMGRATDDELENFRERLFKSQDSYYAQQFRTLDAEETLRALIRALE